MFFRIVQQRVRQRVQQRVQQHVQQGVQQRVQQGAQQGDPQQGSPAHLIIVRRVQVIVIVATAIIVQAIAIASHIVSQSRNLTIAGTGILVRPTGDDLISHVVLVVTVVLVASRNDAISYPAALQVSSHSVFLLHTHSIW